MTIQLHHLHLGQSERIVWLLEEMEIPYELIVYQRDPTTALSPEELKAVSPTGSAPYLCDTNVSPPVHLFESTAIAIYLLDIYGAKSSVLLNRAPGDPEYTTFLQWFHYANGSLQPTATRQLMLTLGTGSPTTPAVVHGATIYAAQLRLVDDHLAKNKWFAGQDISAADCMLAFTLSTMRGFLPTDLGGFPNILRWLSNVAERPAYLRAVEKGDGGMEPLIQANTRRFTQFPRFRNLF